MPTPVNAENVVTLDLLNLNGSVQFRVTLEGMFQWKLTASNTWYDITSLEGLRGRSVSAVTVNAQNKLVVSFDDNTSATLTLTQLEDAVTRAQNAATQALASAAGATAIAQGTATARPATRASFFQDFANSRFFDPKILTCFSRNSVATYIDRNGFMKTAPVNKPRFQHDSITKESLGLLLEPTSINLLLYSADYTQAAWSKQKITPVVSTNKGIYSTTAQKLVVDGTTDPYILQNYPTSNLVGYTYTFSAYLWTDEPTPTKAIIRIFGSNYEQMQLKNVDVTNIPTKFEVSVTFAGTLTSTGVSVRIDPFDNETDQPTAGRYMYVDATQLEQGYTSTSYIHNTSTRNTRNTDLISISGTLFSEIFPSLNEGTIFLNASKAPYRGAGNYKYYYKFSGVNNNIISLTDTDNSRIYNEISKDSTSVFNANLTNINTNDFFNNVLAFKYNDARAYTNGTASTQDNDVQLPVGITQFIIGGEISTIIKSIAFWPRRVSDIAMSSLTMQSLFGKNPTQVPTISDLMAGAFISPYAILRSQGKNLFKINGTGVQVTDNINLNFDFTFEIVTTAGATIISTPNPVCTAGIDNLLVVNVPIGKTLWYAITPIFEY